MIKKVVATCVVLLTIAGFFWEQAWVALAALFLCGGVWTIYEIIRLKDAQEEAFKMGVSLRKNRP